MDDETQLAVAAAGMKAAAPIILAALNETGQALKAVSSTISERVLRELRVGYSDFLTVSYNRCQQVKTLVSGDQPVPLLEAYVNLKLNNSAGVIDDTSIIDGLSHGSRIVISGTGGAGKSMLMKYITICRFENPRGKIPLFIELRSLNSLTSKELLQYCFSSCSTSKQRVSFSSFEKIFEAGGFILILDGFDEIDSDVRNDVERQILDLGRKYPLSTIIVSSRNDPRFKGWQDYIVYEVCRLDQKQVNKLIGNLRFDKGIKRRFLKEVPSLWKTHETFLSIPLLSVIMLITFGKFSEISPKATLFYKLAFQTLFREHDASKEQFKRPIYTNLGLDDFEKSFSAFCALSYLDGKIAFSESLAGIFAEKAMRYCRLKPDAVNLVKDLVENVCMLQEEGGELTYIHRSFQEYFTALFLIGYHEDNVFDVINEVATRDSDSTLSMFRELDESKFEREWLIPCLDSYITSLESALSTKSASESMRWIFSAAMFNSDLELDGLMLTEPGKSAILRNIGRVYPEYADKISTGNLFAPLRRSDFMEIFKQLAPPNRSRKLVIPSTDSSKRRSAVVSLNFNRDDDAWLEEIGIYKELHNIYLGLIALKKAVIDVRKRQGAVIEVS